jgi:hypothetical protein
VNCAARRHEAFGGVVQNCRSWRTRAGLRILWGQEWWPQHFERTLLIVRSCKVEQSGKSCAASTTEACKPGSRVEECKRKGLDHVPGQCCELVIMGTAAARLLAGLLANLKRRAPWTWLNYSVCFALFGPPRESMHARSTVKRAEIMKGCRRCTHCQASSARLVVFTFPCAAAPL